MGQEKFDGKLNPNGGGGHPQKLSAEVIIDISQLEIDHNQAKLNQSLEVTSPECRICAEEHDKQDSVPLSLCQCRGTMGHIHASCLERWLQSSNAKGCEFCKQIYNFELEPSSWTDYIKKGLCSTPRHVAMVIVPLLFLLFFVFIGLLIGYSIWSPTSVFMSPKRHFNVPYLCALLLILFFFFWVFFVKIVRLHMEQWRSWRESNPKKVVIKTTIATPPSTVIWNPPVGQETGVAPSNKY